MKPVTFDMRFPGTLAEALQELADGGEDARAIAGGQSLVPLLNFRMSTPSVLVDLGDVEELRYIRRDDDGTVRIGAMTTLATLQRSTQLAASHPLVVDAIKHVAHAPIRNRTTLGGTLAHADPSAEMPAVALALGATMIVASTTARREVPAEDFFQGPYTTAHEEDELLIEIRFPAQPPGLRSAIYEVARRPGDFALAGAVCALTVTERIVRDFKVVVFAAASQPTSLAAIDQQQIGASFDDDMIDNVAARYATELATVEDLQASEEFRSHLVGVVVGRALRAAQQQ